MWTRGGSEIVYKDSQGRLMAAEAWGVATVNIDGIQARDLARFLMDKYRIIVVPIVGGAYPNQMFDYQTMRVSPNIYTTLEEIDSFVMAMEDALKNGVPVTQGQAPSRNELRAEELDV